MQPTEPHRLLAGPKAASQVPAPPLRTSPEAAEEPARAAASRRITAIVLSVLALLLIAAVVVALLYVDRLQSAFEDNRNVIEGLDDLDDDSAYRTSEGTINIAADGLGQPRRIRGGVPRSSTGQGESVRMC